MPGMQAVARHSQEEAVRRRHHDIARQGYIVTSTQRGPFPAYGSERLEQSRAGGQAAINAKPRA
jgi:hypothetical protein